MFVWHQSEIKDYPRPLGKLARELADLKYDVLAEFLREFSLCMEEDSQADLRRKRPKLAKELRETSKALSEAHEAVERAWRICEPHMT